MRNHKLLNDKTPKETVEPKIEQTQDTQKAKETSTTSNSSNSFSNLSPNPTNNPTATLPIPSQTNQSFDAKKIITDSDQKIEPKVAVELFVESDERLEKELEELEFVLVSLV